MEMICEMCGGSGEHPDQSGSFCPACDGRGRVGGPEPIKPQKDCGCPDECAHGLQSDCSCCEFYGGHVMSCPRNPLWGSGN